MVGRLGGGGEPKLLYVLWNSYATYSHVSLSGLTLSIHELADICDADLVNCDMARVYAVIPVNIEEVLELEQSPIEGFVGI